MLKSYKAVYENGTLNWLGDRPLIGKTEVIVMIEESSEETPELQSIKKLKGIAPKPLRVVSLEEMENAIEQEGAKI